jgi:hypothetical protein
LASTVAIGRAVLALVDRVAALESQVAALRGVSHGSPE